MLSFLVEQALACGVISGRVGCREGSGEKSEPREGERKGDLQGGKMVKEALVWGPAGRAGILPPNYPGLGIGLVKGPRQGPSGRVGLPFLEEEIHYFHILCLPRCQPAALWLCRFKSCLLQYFMYIWSGKVGMFETPVCVEHGNIPSDVQGRADGLWLKCGCV